MSFDSDSDDGDVNATVYSKVFRRDILELAAANRTNFSRQFRLNFMKQSSAIFPPAAAADGSESF